MQWNNLNSDITVGSLSTVISNLECPSLIRLTVNLMRGNRVYIINDCLKNVMDHVSNEKKEVGGLLLGSAWENNLPGMSSTGPLVFILSSISSKVCRNSPVSLEMGTEIWDQVNEQISDGIIVVGWYHSHPNLGAFFSGTDRRTQRAFFNHSYSLGWVIDPFRNEDRVYYGMDSEEYQAALLVMDHELEMEKSYYPL